MRTISTVVLGSLVSILLASPLSAGAQGMVLPLPPHLAGFGNQGATGPVEIEVESGAASYVQVGVLVTVGMVKIVLTTEPPSDAQRDLSNLYQVTPVPQ